MRRLAWPTDRLSLVGVSRYEVGVIAGLERICGERNRFAEASTRAPEVSFIIPAATIAGRGAGREDRVHDGAMPGRQRRGLDYTPLFKFLLSRLDDDWDSVHAEAVGRLDRPEPIFWMVARSDAEKSPFVLIGENAYFSGLFVDADNRLRLVDPDLHVEHMEPGCACCTHTFNGVPFTRKYDPSAG